MCLSNFSERLNPVLADPVALLATIYWIKMSANLLLDANGQEGAENAIWYCKTTEFYYLWPYLYLVNLCLSIYWKGQTMEEDLYNRFSDYTKKYGKTMFSNE